jgi:hypothetical protein
MGRVRLNLRSMSITDKIAKGRQIVSAITDNATFSTPHPPLTEVTTAVDDLEKASANHHRHKQVGQKCCRTGTQNEMIPAITLMFTCTPASRKGKEDATPHSQAQ